MRSVHPYTLNSLHNILNRNFAFICLFVSKYTAYFPKKHLWPLLGEYPTSEKPTLCTRTRHRYYVITESTYKQYSILFSLPKTGNRLVYSTRHSMQSIRALGGFCVWNVKLVIISQLTVIMGHPWPYRLPIKNMRHPVKKQHCCLQTHSSYDRLSLRTFGLAAGAGRAAGETAIKEILKDKRLCDNKH